MRGEGEGKRGKGNGKGGEEDKERVGGEDGQAVMFDDSLDGREFGGEGGYDEEGHAFGGMEYDDGEIQGEEVEEEEVELPEPVYTEEELANMMEKYEADLQQVIEVYEPPPKEEGEEEAAPEPPAEGEEGERGEKPATWRLITYLSRCAAPDGRLGQPDKLLQSSHTLFPPVGHGE